MRDNGMMMNMLLQKYMKVFLIATVIFESGTLNS